ncbi:MAG: HD-GYP domain-containing protein [Motiliproteus sp.]
MVKPAQRIKVDADQLCKGMFVVLPSKWLDHSFLRNQFLIKNDAQLTKLRACHYDEFDIDLDRSTLPKGWDRSPIELDNLDRTSHATESRVIDPKDTGDIPDNWDASNLIPDELSEALGCKNMAPELRSQLVYTHSREMMQRLLDVPTVENLKTAKATITSIADMVLSDDQTARNLLRITSHDFYTYTHSVNVGVTSLMVAKELFRGSDAHDLEELASGFFLHDLGKVMVRPEVINKPGRLDDAEMKHMRIHPYQGYKLLDAAGEMTEESRYIVMQHHERFDGSGYPKGLQNEDIHIYGRICCIADVFDALTADRSYKKAMSKFEALKLMKDQMSGHFDQKLFSEFVNLYRQ